MKTESGGSQRVLAVYEAVLAIGFDGATIEEVAQHSGFNYSLVRRALIALQEQEWVVEFQRSGSNQKLWRPSKKLIGVAFAFKRHCVAKRQLIESEYSEISKEVLGNDR